MTSSMLAQIQAVQAYPSTSDWLKNALQQVLARDPVDVRNDIEILTAVVDNWLAEIVELSKPMRPISEA